ncbi:hypothetical protein HMPREF0204_14611 [Chryseobacterium gleum ATCC 35910]|uniref:Uncharacterized protein n=1 Tax=Chryseobacterium gleum ATCC 35910 TaxID=525257 RepID=A0ABN0AR21_CHRGE|nr:hypothetical protein HMPREF0204_14611 [Chryseobacterium gleum ATCC 35910]
MILLLQSSALYLFAANMIYLKNSTIGTFLNYTFYCIRKRKYFESYY